MRKEGGFTLLEVLVALSILGVTLTVLFAVFGHSLDRSRETQSRLEARAAASALLAQAEAARTLSYGDSGGRLPSGMDWTLSVRPYGNDEDVQAWPAAAAQLTATVRWGGRSAGQSFTLTTLRLLPKEHAP